MNYITPIINSVEPISKMIGLSDYVSNTMFFIILSILLISFIMIIIYYFSGQNILEKGKNMIEDGVNMLGGNAEMNKVMGKNDNVSFTLYYVDWCPHCKSIKPDWEKLEKDKELKHININKVNCEENEEIVQEKNIEGFPTILLNNNGKEEAYNGGREYADFKKYLQTI